MHFRRSGKPKISCDEGARLSTQHGVYVGRFAFKGEGGYVSVQAQRAKGRILRPAGRCRHRRISRKELEKEVEAFFEPTAGLFATSREGVETSSFLGLARKAGTIFLASHEETHGRLAILRIAIAISKAAKGFHANEAVTSATVKPPAPFHGSGRYHAAPDGTQTWSGNLSVKFPGEPRHPLTGPQYEVFIEVPF